MTLEHDTTDLQRRIYRRWAPVYDRIYTNILKKAHKKLAEKASLHGGEVLEIGVGTGLGLPYYSSACKLTGIDISEDMLERAWEKMDRLGLHNVRSLRTMDAHRLEFRQGSFDVVTLPFVLTLVESPERVLDEAVRVTRRGGAIIIASRVSQGGSVQSRVERAIEPLARRCGLSSAFHLSRIEKWCARHGAVSVETIERLRPAGFFKLIILRRD